MTGLFKSGHGRDILIDTGHTDLRFTHNGSEWALDRNGWSVIYTKEVDGVRQMWRGYLEGEKVVARPVTSGETPAFGGVGCINPNADSTRIIAISGAWDGGEKVWVDVKDGTRRHRIGPTIDHTDARWIAGTNLLVSVMEEKEDSGQLLLINTDTGESKRITDDHGRKGRFYGWLAPEAGGKVRVLAVRDKRELVVYEDRGGKFWEAIETHRPPNNGIGMSSPEPFVVGDRSYASVTVGIRPEPGTSTGSGGRTTQIWILDLSGEKRPPVRGDDGSSDPGRRTDAEIFVGAEQVFVIHSYHPPGGQVEVRRTATGIRSQLPAEKRYPEGQKCGRRTFRRGRGYGSKDGCQRSGRIHQRNRSWSGADRRELQAGRRLLGQARRSRGSRDGGRQDRVRALRQRLRTGYGYPPAQRNQGVLGSGDCRHDRGWTDRRRLTSLPARHSPSGRSTRARAGSPFATCSPSAPGWCRMSPTSRATTGRRLRRTSTSTPSGCWRSASRARCSSMAPVATTSWARS